jgi:predicted nucleic acid-binding protein
LPRTRIPQGAPQAVRTWIDNAPTWLEVRKVDVTHAPRTLLDPGELAALTLAEELHADLVLMDERNGRDEAMRRQ